MFILKKENTGFASIPISVPWAYKATVLTVRLRPLLLIWVRIMVYYKCYLILIIINK